MAKNNTALFGLTAALGLGAGAYFLTREAISEEPKDKPKGDPKDEPKEDPKDKPEEKPQPHATIGKPYSPNDTSGNVSIAVKTKPLKHPVGLSKGERPWDDWLANVVYWETFPYAPMIIPANSEYASKWLRIRDLVRIALKPEIKPKDPKDPTKPKEEKPKGHATIGTPYKPGKTFERHNATEVVKHRPGAHPVGKRGSKTSADWLANVAYWETYPMSPVVIPSGDAVSAAAWKRIRSYVVAAMSAGKTKEDDKKGSLHKTIGSPYRPGSDQERANAGIAVRTKPSHHPRGEARKPGQSDADWLANVAYWESWPAGPTKIAAGSSFAPIWTRIRRYVVAALATENAKPKETPKKETPKKETPKKETPKTETPSGPGTAGDLRGNAALAIKKYKSENDRTNAAYWWTWPTAPKKIPKGDKASANKWISARTEVRRQAGTKVSGLEPLRPTALSTWPKESREGARELASAIMAAEVPSSLERATVDAYKRTYGQVPTRPTPADALAASRIAETVQRVRKLWRKLPTQLGNIDPKTSRRIAALLAAASGYRRPDEIAERIRYATSTTTAGDVAPGDPFAMTVQIASGGGAEPSRAFFAAREMD